MGVRLKFVMTLYVLKRCKMEKDILNSGNIKKFYSHVNKRRVAKTGVAPLQTKSEKMTVVSDKEKAEGGVDALLCRIFGGSKPAA